MNGSRGVVTHFESAETLLKSLEQRIKQIMEAADAVDDLSYEEKDELVFQAQRRCARFEAQKEWVCDMMARGEDTRVPWVHFSSHTDPVPILPVSFSFRTVVSTHAKIFTTASNSRTFSEPLLVFSGARGKHPLADASRPTPPTTT